jgi:putative restriction endonuclease
VSHRPKEELHATVLQAITDCGWQPVALDRLATHPLHLLAIREGQGMRVRLHIWNLMHDGRSRQPDEHRVQVIPPEPFVAEAGTVVLVLGWWAAASLFAAFDCERHTEKVGGSPSMQIREQTLRDAHVRGIAAHANANGEVAVAFCPDLLMSYVANQRGWHGAGESPDDLEAFNAAAVDPYAVNEDVIDRVTAPRRVALANTVQALRERSFRTRVLTAYEHTCAACGLRLGPIHATHILPVPAEGSTDDTSNGLALCPTHHEAYDAALIDVSDEYRVGVSQARLIELRSGNLHGGEQAFRDALLPYLKLPADVALRPHVEFLRRSREIRRWVS